MEDQRRSQGGDRDEEEGETGEGIREWVVRLPRRPTDPDFWVLRLPNWNRSGLWTNSAEVWVRPTSSRPVPHRRRERVPRTTVDGSVPEKGSGT